MLEERTKTSLPYGEAQARAAGEPARPSGRCKKRLVSRALTARLVGFHGARESPHGAGAGVVSGCLPRSLRRTAPSKAVVSKSMPLLIVVIYTRVAADHHQLDVGLGCSREIVRSQGHDLRAISTVDQHALGMHNLCRNTYNHFISIFISRLSIGANWSSVNRVTSML